MPKKKFRKLTETESEKKRGRTHQYLIIQYVPGYKFCKTKIIEREREIEIERMTQIFNKF